MRFALRNEFFKDDKKRVATVTSFGGWLDLEKRKLTSPPEQLAKLLDELPRCEDFRELASAGT